MVLYKVQYLRFLAAFFVVFYHVTMSPWLVLGWDDGVEKAKVLFGPVGVDLFFVISGFIICYIILVGGDDAKGFYMRRLTRIVPLYWGATLVLFFMPSFLEVYDDKVTFYELFRALFFIATPHPASENTVFYPIYTPGWTINYEVFFYVVASGVLLLSGAMRREVLAGLTIAILTALVVVGYYVADTTFLGFYTHTIILEFVYGMIAACLYTRGILPKPPLAILMIALGALGIVLYPNLNSVTEDTRYIFWGIPSALILYGAVASETHCESRHLKWAKTLGDASYAIYMTHLFMIGSLMSVWINFGITFEGPGFLIYQVVGIAGSLLLGIAVFRYVERPILAFFRKRFVQGKTVAKDGDSIKSTIG